MYIFPDTLVLGLFNFTDLKECTNLICITFAWNISNITQNLCIIAKLVTVYFVFYAEYVMPTFSCQCSSGPLVVAMKHEAKEHLLWAIKCYL